MPKIEQSTIMIPTKNGHGYVELQADYLDLPSAKDKSQEVFAIVVDLDKEKELTEKKYEDKTPPRFYTEEIEGLDSLDGEATN